MPSDLNNVAPTSLCHIVGQRAVVNQFRVALDAAFEDGKRLDDCLLVGPPGLGKTQVAAVLAQELAVKCHEALGQSIKSAADLNVLLLAAKDKDIVFIDECHELPKVFQTSLYLAVDNRQIIVSGSRSFQSVPLAGFALLLGTTDKFSLLQPLRNRMKLVLRFQFYTVEELTRIVTHRARAVDWSVDELVPPLIAQRARGTPRLALRLSSSTFAIRSIAWSSLSSNVAIRCVRCSQFRQKVVPRSFMGQEDTHPRPSNQDQPDAYRTQEFWKILGGALDMAPPGNKTQRL